MSLTRAGILASAGGGGGFNKTGLIYWGDMESDGSDSHTTGHDMAATGTISHPTGKVGNAADFVQGSEFQKYSSTDAAFDITSGDLTLMFWFNVDNVTHSDFKGLIGKHQSAGNDRSYYTYMSGNDLFFGVSGDGSSVDVDAQWANSVVAGTYYHVIAEFESGVGGRLYVNNDLKATDTTAITSIHSSSIPLDIGSIIDDSQSNGMEGLVDTPSVWTRLLTSDERAFFYNSGSGVPYS